jgi:hypothetical protein
MDDKEKTKNKRENKMQKPDDRVSQRGTDKDPKKEMKRDNVTVTDLKGKKVDADLSQESERP